MQVLHGATELRGVQDGAGLTVRAIGFVVDPVHEKMQLEDVRRDCEGGGCTLRATVLSSAQDGRNVVVESGSSQTVVRVRGGRGDYSRRLTGPDDTGAAPRILGIVASSP